MSLSLPMPAHTPCPACGASVRRTEADAHRCDPERRLDFVMFQLRGEVESFGDALRSYLDSPQGRFEQWAAEQRRPASGS